MLEAAEIIAEAEASVGVADTDPGVAGNLERLVAARTGETVAVGPWQVEFRGIEPVAGPNWTALEADMVASYGDGDPVAIRPQSRSFWSPPQQTAESALITKRFGQLYVVLGEPAGDGRWQLRLWWKPMVTLIWLGGILIALGGLLSLFGRVAADIRRAVVRVRIASRREDMGR